MLIQNKTNTNTTIQQIYFTGNLHKATGEIINVNTIMFFIIEEAKEKILDFSQGTVKVL